MQMTSPQHLFSESRRNAVEIRAMHISKNDADFLSEIAAQAITDRLAVINRNFHKAVDFLSTHNVMVPALQKLSNVGIIDQIISEAKYSKSPNTNAGKPEFVPLEPNSTNLITSVFALHRSNDLPGSLIQIRRALINDGLFMAALPGENTLRELRECLITAESEVHGSASLRVEPFGEIRQLGGLLQRAGFTLPVVDSEIYTIRYENFNALIKDLRAMGATNTLAQQPAFASRKLFQKAREIYEARHKDKDEKITATAEIVFLSGWAPDKSQQKPLKPGSAKAALKDFL